MSQQIGEKVYTEKELQKAIDAETRAIAKNQLYVWTLRATDTMTKEEILKEVNEAINEANN